MLTIAHCFISHSDTLTEGFVSINNNNSFTYKETHNNAYYATLFCPTDPPPCTPAISPNMTPEETPFQSPFETPIQTLNPTINCAKSENRNQGIITTVLISTVGIALIAAGIFFALKNIWPSDNLSDGQNDENQDTKTTETKKEEVNSIYFEIIKLTTHSLLWEKLMIFVCIII